MGRLGEAAEADTSGRRSECTLCDLLDSLPDEDREEAERFLAERDTRGFAYGHAHLARLLNEAYPEEVAAVLARRPKVKANGITNPIVMNCRLKDHRGSSQ
jgi:hypothetical protein